MMGTVTTPGTFADKSKSAATTQSEPELHETHQQHLVLRRCRMDSERQTHTAVQSHSFSIPILK